MKLKLTLSLDEALILNAKSYARKRGVSLSEIVGAYLQGLPGDEAEQELTPTVRLLYGALNPSNVNRKAYRKHLERKYR